MKVLKSRLATGGVTCPRSNLSKLSSLLSFLDTIPQLLPEVFVEKGHRQRNIVGLRSGNAARPADLAFAARLEDHCYDVRCNAFVESIA